MYTNTFFIDIDGTILELIDPFEDIISGKANPKALKDVPECLRNLHIAGHKIIITTGRPECLRDLTIKSLKEQGIVYDQLIMAVGSGPRYLINDKNNKPFNKAYAINIEANGSFPDELKDII